MQYNICCDITPKGLDLFTFCAALAHQKFPHDQISVLNEANYRDRVRSAFESEPKLKEVVEAVLDLDLYKPEEIADAIGTTPTDIQNRKKKLRRRLGATGLVTARTKKADTYEKSHS